MITFANKLTDLSLIRFSLDCHPHPRGLSTEQSECVLHSDTNTDFTFFRSPGPNSWNVAITISAGKFKVLCLFGVVWHVEGKRKKADEKLIRVFFYNCFLHFLWYAKQQTTRYFEWFCIIIHFLAAIVISAFWSFELTSVFLQNRLQILVYRNGKLTPRWFQKIPNPMMERLLTSLQNTGITVIFENQRSLMFIALVYWFGKFWLRKNLSKTVIYRSLSWQFHVYVMHNAFL